MAQRLRDAVEHFELGAKHAVRLRVAEALGPARRIVLAGEMPDLVDHRADVALLVRRDALLGERESLVGPTGVLQRLQRAEDERAKEAIERLAVQELEAPLQPPGEENEVVDGA